MINILFYFALSWARAQDFDESQSLRNCKTELVSSYSLYENVSSAHFGSDGLFNYKAGQALTIDFASGRSFGQRVHAITELPSTVQRLVRRLKLLTVTPHLECGFREVGAFVFEFDDGKFQPVVHTLNQATTAIDGPTFDRLFDRFLLRRGIDQVFKIWYVHYHPSILDPCIRKLYEVPFADAREARAARRPWDSLVYLSEDDFRAAKAFKQAFDATLGSSVPFEIVALSTIPRFAELYFSHEVKHEGPTARNVNRSSGQQ